MDDLVQLPVHVPELKVRYPARRAVPTHMPAQYFLGLICGSRGSGKTTALVQLVKAYDAAESMDHLWLWTPTFHSDPKYALLDSSRSAYKLHLYDRDFDEADFRAALAQIEGINAEYEAHEAYGKAWKRFLRARHPEHELKDADLLLLEKHAWQPPDPALFPRGRPTHLLVFDDCVGSRSLYRADSKGAVASFVIKHRHAHCNVIFLTQIFNNAVPKQIRSNLSWVVLFAQKNEAIRKAASLEFSSHVSAERFAQMWEAATQAPHGFFFADFEAPPEVRYRAGFDRAFRLTGSYRAVV
jgi:hypothetical protein